MKRRLWIILIVAMVLGMAPASGLAKNITFTTISTGYQNSFAIKKDGSLWAWGDNSLGQLGDGTTTIQDDRGTTVENNDKSSPVKIMDNVASISAKWFHSLAIKTDSSLWVWGFNEFGQLGDGSTSSRNIPVKIMSDVAFAYAGYVNSFVIKTDGSLWGWGYNAFGQLGDGTTDDRNTPVKIMDDVTYVTDAVSTYGPGHVFAIKKDGSLWGWGYQYVGDGASIARRSPVKIMDKVADIAVTDSSCFALKTDSSLWAWGYNSYGTLGDGTTEDVRLTPVKVMDNVVFVQVTDYQSFAVKADGSLWGWGWNEYGQLGDGTTEKERRKPVKIMDNVSFFAAGYSCKLAIKTDGSLWAWGDTLYVQPEDKASVKSGIPVKIMENVVYAISGGDTSNHCFAVKTDGSLWGWGWNDHGQVGYGPKNWADVIDIHKPTRIMDNIKLPDDITAQIPISNPNKDIIQVILNGQSLTFDQPPILDNGRTLVPLRVIFEALGTKVDWDQAMQTVTATKDEVKITMQIGNSIMVRNGNNITLDVPPKFLNGRTLVPLRAVAEAFDAEVGWDGINRTVTIMTK